VRQLEVGVRVHEAGEDRTAEVEIEGAGLAHRHDSIAVDVEDAVTNRRSPDREKNVGSNGDSGHCSLIPSDASGPT
jgi:hypothetical protein